MGIEPEEFGAALVSSGICFTKGLILESQYTWVCFHGFFDFGYIYKLVSGEILPAEESLFLEMLFKYFPQIYDVKYMAERLLGTTSSLSRYAEQYSIDRIGTLHQAGSDSYVTSEVFMRMRSQLDKCEYTKLTNCHNVIYGLGESSKTCDKYLPDEASLSGKIENGGEFKTKQAISKHIYGICLMCKVLANTEQSFTSKPTGILL